VAGSLSAAPITFNEVSLLVRMRETDTYLIQQLSERRLLRAINPGQEAALRAQGASDALLQALRDPVVILSNEEAVAFETWSEEQKRAIERKIAAEAAEREAIRAEQAALAARLLEEARARASAEAAVSASRYRSAYDYDSAGYAPYGYGGIISSSGCYGRPSHGSFSSGSLQWQNGTATTYTSPGLSFHPFGTNGSTLNTGQSGHGGGKNCAPGGGVSVRYGR
jgi:hypothetical protein